MKTLAALLALPLAAATPAAPPDAPPAAAAVEALRVAPGVVDVPTAKKLVAAGATVVDVRTPAEFQAGHVPGAINIPFDQIARRHGEIGPTGTPVVVYCRTGRRSGIAADALRASGFQRVYDFQVYDRWVQAERK